MTGFDGLSLKILNIQAILRPDPLEEMSHWSKSKSLTTIVRKRHGTRIFHCNAILV